MAEMPQIRCALSRNFAVSGLILLDRKPRAALEDSLALGYYRPPCSGLSVCCFADRFELSADSRAPRKERACILSEMGDFLS
jgi:hypothetical protein